MVQDLAIFGAGGLGREIALMVSQINEAGGKWNLIGFFDDQAPATQRVDGFPVLGDRARLNDWPTHLAMVLAVSDPSVRKMLAEKIANPRLEFPVLIHPRALPGSMANRMGRGTIVGAGSAMTTGISMGEFVIINPLATIGHDTEIGSFSSIMPGCNVGGGVVMEEECLAGAGAQILQYRKIGARCRIGAGAVVTRDVPEGVTVKGVPGRW